MGNERREGKCNGEEGGGVSEQTQLVEGRSWVYTSTEEKMLGYTGRTWSRAWFLGGPGRGQANGYGGKVSPCRSKGL